MSKDDVLLESLSRFEQAEDDEYKNSIMQVMEEIEEAEFVERVPFQFDFESTHPTPPTRRQKPRDTLTTSPASASLTSALLTAERS